MARRRIDNWQLRKCAKACEQCESLFKDKQSLYSLLFFDNNEYVRRDVCDSCAKKEKHALSRWRTRFVLPAPSINQIEKKEDVESLLRKLLALEDDSNLNAIFILTVMLERQKRLKERAVQKTPEGSRALR